MTSSQAALTRFVKSERLHFRLASESDVEPITCLINRAYANGNTYLLKERITLARVRSYLQKGHFLLIEEEGQIVGLRYVEFLGNERAYVGLLSVDPDKQRAGLGRRLHDASEQFCRVHGCDVIEGMVINLNKDVLERNRRFGYEVVGTVTSENFPEYADHVNGSWHFIKIEKLL